MWFQKVRGTVNRSAAVGLVVALLFPLGARASHRHSDPPSSAVVGMESSPDSKSRLLVGLAENPPANEQPSPEVEEKWYGKAVAAGISMQQITPKWDEMERSDGTYDFHELDLRGAIAKKFGLPVYLSVRIIDTLARSMPAQYKEWRFNDPRMTAKLTALLQAMRSHTAADVRWIAIGNEVDPYFLKHPDEVNSYRQLIQNLTPVVKKLFPGVVVAVNFRFDALGQLSKELKPIYDVSEILSVTYYPLNLDFTVRSTASIQADFKTILAAASGKPIMFQEVGYPSSELLGSSPAKQAQFLQIFFDTLRAHPSNVIGMTYLFMSDFSQALVDSFGKYYDQPDNTKFKAFLATLGLFDREANPKPAWNVFVQNAQTK
jgi:hypothetical protein